MGKIGNYFRGPQAPTLSAAENQMVSQGREPWARAQRRGAESAPTPSSSPADAPLSDVGFLGASPSDAPGSTRRKTTVEYDTKAGKRLFFVDELINNEGAGTSVTWGDMQKWADRFEAAGRADGMRMGLSSGRELGISEGQTRALRALKAEKLHKSVVAAGYLLAATAIGLGTTALSQLPNILALSYCHTKTGADHAACKNAGYTSIALALLTGAGCVLSTVASAYAFIASRLEVQINTEGGGMSPEDLDLLVPPQGESGMAV